jgi:zinc transport system substrate-binding protein
VRPWPLTVALVAGTLAGTGSSPASAAAEPPKVVATIPPIHSLAAAVMAGASEPVLLVQGNASPHGYQLRPSEAAAIQGADVVVWVGSGLESFMERPLGNLGGGTRVVTLLEAAGVERLPAREGGAWEAHEAEAEEHHEAGEGEREDHGHGEHDPHVWLSPANARAMVRAIAAALAAADPERAALYRANEERTVAELAALDAELKAALAPVRGKPFVVFHDAYQYLEAAYGLNAAGSITVSPDRPPSARRLVELAEKIDRSGAVCVFGEVRTASPLVGTLIAGRGIGTGQLDPEGGTTVTPGPKAYTELMRRNVDVLVDCLSRPS